MTINAYIFSWDCYGIESIIPITQYEGHENQQLINMIMDKPTIAHPLSGIIGSLKMRARFNHHRFYEIYAVDCDDGMTIEFWKKQWDDYPQETADLIRSHGVKIYSDRRPDSTQVKIT